MARIHIDSDDELPEFATLLRTRTAKTLATTSPAKASRRAPSAETASANEQCMTARPKQRALKKAPNVASLFAGSADLSSEKSLRSSGRDNVRRSPRKPSMGHKTIQIFQDLDTVLDGDESRDLNDSDIDSDGSFHVSNDEDSEADLEEPRSPNRIQGSPLQKLLDIQTRPSIGLQDTFRLPLPPKVHRSTSNPFVGPRKEPADQTSSASTARPMSYSSAVDPDAILRYTPPQRLSPTKRASHDRPVTPPTEAPPSPSKKLVSPSKSRFMQIPKAPVRESIDAFWSQGAINEWNEQYSPKKLVASPRKNRFTTPTPDDENDPPSPSTSPWKRSPMKSPVKSPVKSRAQREMKKVWEQRKHDAAQAFLDELDEKVANGRLAEMTSSTGGVKIVWSKKLNSTAGRANWRREAANVRQVDGSSAKTYKHHASIELAEKVIDDEDRLVNVIAHEFCHLCNFMISNIRDNPHGTEFKKWARKCSAMFGHRGIEVTTKHSYEIDYKYVWECTECGHEYKRHSKSIDPAKQGCGSCKGRLLQTKPAPRGGGPSEYQVFIKQHFQRVKTDNPGASHGAVMEILGREYREGKKGLESIAMTSTVVEETTEMDALVKELEIVTIEDSEA